MTLGRPPSLARDHACPSCSAPIASPCISGGKPISRYHAARKRLAGLEPDPSGRSGTTGAERARRKKLTSKE